MPVGHTPGLKPLSLSSMFDGPIPALQRRVQIAQQITEGLLYLHAVDWLHKGLRSNGVLFFSSDNGGRPSAQAYISGFEYSRQIENGLTTTGPPEEPDWAVYIHPDCLVPYDRPRYRKTYDIYSLGIILIELALWARIGKIVQLTPTAGETKLGAWREDEGKLALRSSAASVPGKPSTSLIRTMRSHILSPKEGVLDKVEAAVGARYRNAVEACIVGMTAFGLPEDKDQSNPVIAGLLQQAFISEVVDPLKSIQI